MVPFGNAILQKLSVPLTITVGGQTALTLKSFLTTGSLSTLTLVSNNGRIANFDGGDIYIKLGATTPYVPNGGGITIEPYNGTTGGGADNRAYARLMFNTEKANLGGGTTAAVILSAHKYHSNGDLHRHLSLYTHNAAGVATKRMNWSYGDDVVKFEVVNSYQEITGNITLSSANPRGLNIYPNFDGDGAGPAAIGNGATYMPTASITTAYGIANNPEFNPDTGITISNAQVFYSRFGTGNNAGVITNAYTINAVSPSMGTLKPSNLTGVRVGDQGSSGITTSVGVDIEAQTASTTTIGLRIALPTGSTAYALQLSDTAGTAAGGITFSTDVQLFRSAANILTLNDKLRVVDQANNLIAFQVDPTNSINSANQRGIKSNPTFTGSGAGGAGIEASPIHQPSATVSTVYGFINLPNGQPGSGVTITNMYANFNRIDTGSTAGAITTATGLFVENPSLGSLKPTTINGIKINNQGETGATTSIGIDVVATTGADTTNIGVRIAKGDTYALQLSDTGGTAPGGITFGTDTNLYRSAANTLKTDDAFIATGLITATAGITILDAQNIVLDVTTGTKIGTATTQKLGFYNATPIVQPSAYTQTYSTADKTHANSTFATVAETAATNVTPFGYTTQAQADAIPVELNDLGDDVTDLKQLVNSLIDDLQALGLVG